MSDACADCGRLAIELAKEVVKTTAMEQVIFAQQLRIDQMEHERAVDSGPAMVAEVETWLADQGGGP